MIECYKTEEGVTNRIDTPEPGSWVNVVSPTLEERDWLLNEVGILPEFVTSTLDDEERSRVDFDDDTGQALIIVDCPFVEDTGDKVDPTITQYDTHPLSVVVLPERDLMVTVSLRENDMVRCFVDGRMRNVNSNQRARLLLRILLRVSQRYLTYLRDIDRQFKANEQGLRNTMRNNELIKMLGLEKSLVYFSTSLKSMEATLTRISNGRVMRLYEDDRDLLDDVFIEVRQGVEMCDICRRMLSGSMDTFGSIISNNLNITMRRLTIITLVLAVPTIVFSFYGMNTDTLPLVETWVTPCVISLVGCLITALIFTKSRFFK